MRARLNAAYSRLRLVPGIGVLASRLVWAVKGALGRPVRWAVGDPALSVAFETDSFNDAQGRGELPMLFAIASAALEGLDTRMERRPTPITAVAQGVRSPSETPRVSIVINTYNRAPHLRRTLQALSQLRYPAFELIAVNGPSTDDTETVLAEFAGPIRLA